MSQQIQQGGSGLNFGQQPLNITYGAPYYGGYTSGGGSLDYGYGIQPYGGSPWDSLTASGIYSTPQYQAYSAPRDRSWEDLAGIAGTVLPFFL